MITSAKNYTKKQQQQQQQNGRQNPGTNGKSKAIQTKSHTEAYTYTLTQREKGENIYISLLPKSTSSIWDDSLSIQVFYSCRYIKLTVEISSAAPEAAGRDFPFSVCTAPGVQLWIWPRLCM